MTLADNHEQDFFVETALRLFPQQRKQFLLLLDPEVRTAIVKRLEEVGDQRDGTVVDFGDADEDRSAATLQDLPTSASGNAKSGNAKSGNDKLGNDKLLDPVPGSATLVTGDRDRSYPAVVSGDVAGDVAGDVVDDGEARLLSAGGGDSRHGSGVHLVKLHAKGAIGEVFVAYDEKLSREVAIKRIRPELAPNKKRVQRFLREAEITAKLQHPGIVPIYNMGDKSGSPHYTMPLVSGMTMAELIRQTHKELENTTSLQQWMSVMRPLLRHFIAVCNAIDYAHDENVLHRDLKPSNIMIGSRGQTMVLDWGCAKNMKETPVGGGADGSAERDSLLASIDGLTVEVSSGQSAPAKKVSGDITISGSVMGTVEFMSPEQAAGDNERVGVPSDIFGLGATLFSLLTNYRSVEYGSEDEVRVALRRVSRGEFRRIEDVDARVPPPITAICKKAMAYNPKSRYATAGDLRKDVEAFLAGEVVEAYPESLNERMLRRLRRHQALFATLAGLLLFGVLSLVAINLVVNRQKDRLASLNQKLSESAVKEKDLLGQAQRQLYGSEMLLASESALEAGGTGRMRELVGKWAGEQYDSLRGWEWDHLNQLGNQELWSVKKQITANQILATRDAGTVKVFDRGQAKVLAIDLAQQKTVGLEKVDSKCKVVDFNRDQTRMAMGCSDGRVVIKSLVPIADDELKPIGHSKHSGGVLDVKWNIGGDLVASCDSEGNVIVWHVGDRRIAGRGKAALNQPNSNLLGWSFDGHQLFWTTGGALQCLDIETQEQNEVLSDGWILNQCQSHEGELLAYIGPDNTIVVATVAGEILHRFEGHQLFVESLQWHPSKHLLLSSSDDGTVRIWNADTRKLVRQLLGHDGAVYDAVFDPSGTQVVSGGLAEDSIRVWDVGDIDTEAFARELQEQPAFAWLPDDKSLVVAEGSDLLIQSDEGESRWIRADGQWSQVIHGVDYHPAQKLIACVSGNGKVWTVDAASGKLEKVYDPGSVTGIMFPPITSHGVQWSPDGRFLAGVGGQGNLLVWNVESGDLVSEGLRPDRVMSVAWSPIAVKGQQRLATVGIENEIVIFDPDKKETVQSFQQYGWKTGLAWSPDGLMLAVSDRRNVNVWDVAEGSLVATCKGPSAIIFDVGWSASGDRIAALAGDGKLCVWDAVSFSYLAKFAIHQRTPYCVRWSKDGKRLVSTSQHGRIVFQNVE